MNTFTISSRWLNAYGFEPTYKWFVNELMNNTTDFEVDKVSEDFFTMCMPTGTGKSGETYKAIINYINDALNNNRRIIINISSPLLKLNEQLYLDMMFLLLEVYNNITSPYYNNFCKISQFFFNSSENNTAPKLFNINNSSIIKNNICIGNISPCNFSNEFDTFVEDKNKKIAIVCSCNKSLHNFIDYISKNKLKDKDFEIRNFLDESHKICDRQKANADDDSDFVNINKLCKYSTGVIAISATPDENITKDINSFSKDHRVLKDLDDPYAIHIYPKDAINMGKILEPRIDLWCTSSTEINASLISEIYNNAHEKNPTVKYHKILVNCPCGNIKELKKIKVIYNKLNEQYKDKIGKDKLRIYCTSFDTNFLYTTNDDIKSMKDFTSSIDNAECDCIILHVKQMIAGIDISSITQTVMYLTDINDTIMRTIIQTCGRCLRIGKGDRIGKYAKPYDERIKKFGLCTFIISEDDYNTEDRLREYFIRYYMLDDIKFSKRYAPYTNSCDTIGHPMHHGNSKKLTFINLKFTIDFNNYITKNKEILQELLGFMDIDDVIISRIELVNMLNKDNNTHIFDNRQIIGIIKKKLFDLKNN